MGRGIREFWMLNGLVLWDVCLGERRLLLPIPDC